MTSAPARLGEDALRKVQPACAAVHAANAFAICVAHAWGAGPIEPSARVSPR
jgi:hypothetical protein